jgi:hypothetical protein
LAIGSCRHAHAKESMMARQDQKTTDRRREEPDAATGTGERGNEFGGDGSGPKAATAATSAANPKCGPDRNTNAWHGDRRQKFVEKFDRWRSERAARTADRGPVSASAGSSRRETGRSAKK